MSRRHSNDALSFALNVNCGAVLFVAGLGPVLIVVSGATVSTVKPRVAGTLSRLPAGSTARTDSVCAPCASSGVVNGFGHAVCPTPSIAHSNVAPASDENVNVGVVSLTGPSGPLKIAVSGSTVSTVTVRVVAVLGFVAASMAVTA